MTEYRTPTMEEIREATKKFQETRFDAYAMIWWATSSNKPHGNYYVNEQMRIREAHAEFANAMNIKPKCL